MLCEKYECQNNLSKLTFGNTQPTFDEVLAKACSYSVLSYNIKRDCILIFASQQKDVNEILAKLSKANRASDTTAEMSEIYRKIEEKDWLFYNNLVRFAFFNKYIEIAESTYTWELGSGANKFVPFGIDAKTIAREKVAFLKDSGSLFVSCTIDTLSKSNYLKKQDVLKIQKDLSAEEVRMLKVSYISKFYDYEKIKSYDNLFYDKRIGDGARIPDKILEDYSKIPLRFYIKLRLLETWSGLDNADNSVIKKIAQELFVEDKNLITNMVQQVQTIDLVEDSSAPKPVYECDEAIEIDNYKTKYISGGSSIIGYKIS